MVPRRSHQGRFPFSVKAARTPSQSSTSRGSSRNLLLLRLQLCSTLLLMPFWPARVALLRMSDAIGHHGSLSKGLTKIWRLDICQRLASHNGGSDTGLSRTFSGSTSGPKMHLQRCHDLKTNVDRTATAKGVEIGMASTFAHAEAHPKPRRRPDFGVLDPDVVEHLYVQLVTAVSLPFRLVEVPEFRAFLQYLDPDFQLVKPGSKLTHSAVIALSDIAFVVLPLSIVCCLALAAASTPNAYSGSITTLAPIPYLRALSAEEKGESFVATVRLVIPSAMEHGLGIF
ncbi:hypothetical protein BJ878DRAFT_478399 [Calycina marina]|uniref:Uncharacterized protein n=1 Tax=Calycina marina TaxID=1763456 RepID=A0A9P7Z7D6_9HELO|nr:hypothetical protein BJ878DRAFT_478399 [Calycina marina]